MIPTVGANGAPAFGQYKPAEGGGYEPWALQVLEIRRRQDRRAHVLPRHRAVLPAVRAAAAARLTRRAARAPTPGGSAPPACGHEAPASSALPPRARAKRVGAERLAECRADALVEALLVRLERAPPSSPSKRIRAPSSSAARSGSAARARPVPRARRGTTPRPRGRRARRTRRAPRRTGERLLVVAPSSAAGTEVDERPGDVDRVARARGGARGSPRTAPPRHAIRRPIRATSPRLFSASACTAAIGRARATRATASSSTVCGALELARQRGSRRGCSATELLLPRPRTPVQRQPCSARRRALA